MKKRIANLTSNILNPFLVALVLILLASFESAADIPDAIKWSLILIALSVLPTYLAAVYLVRNSKMDNIFTNVRQQRTRIYVLTVILAVISVSVLFYLKAPLMLIALCVAGFSTTVMYLVINLWWKISLHAALTTALAAIPIILYGFAATATIVLIPLIVWSRIELKCHSTSQAVTGVLLAIFNLATVFYLFGLI